MSKKHVTARRERLRELGKMDAENRCRFCRRALPVGYLVLVTASGATLRYCDDGCRADEISASEARR